MFSAAIISLANALEQRPDLTPQIIERLRSIAGDLATIESLTVPAAARQPERPRLAVVETRRA